MEHLSQHVNVMRWSRGWAFAGLYALLLSLGCAFVEAAVPLNVVIIKTDDQRWDTLWAMPIVQEELVRHGVTFANAFVSTPLCCPERASFLAGGFYAHNTGVLTNEIPNGGVTKFLDRDTLPVRLQRARYRTALIGKYLNNYPLIQPYIPPGWTKFLFAFGGADWMNYRAIIGSSGPEAPSSGRAVQVSQYVTDYLRDEALEFLRQTGSSPFFLYLTPSAPHTPAIPAPEDEDLFANYVYRGRGYKAGDLRRTPYRQNSVETYDPAAHDELYRQQLRSLQAVDRAVGAIVQELKALGKFDTTLLVFMSDNGYLWGEHGLSAKIHPYEESIRVPLVMVMPGIHPRVDNHFVVANLDVPTTIFAVAGISRSDTDGHNLVPLLRNPRRHWREEFFLETYGIMQRTWAGLRTSRYKYIEWASGHKALFDLFADTYELDNKIDDPTYQSIQQELAERLQPLKGLAITHPTRFQGKVHTSFVQSLSAWGGTKPYLWSVVEGSLPPEITLDGVAGRLTGTPTQAGTFQVQIQVTDASVSPYTMQPQTHIQPFTFVIKP
jgi:arylsulfatase A-like enzyme